WDIFTIVTNQISPGVPVAFDITHGLRSFPLIGLLVSAFLRSSNRVDLHAVLYGAFDVRDQTVMPNRTPMFDLTPMLDLLEWASAADRFTRTGDARYLASLGKREQKALAAAAGKDRDQMAQVGALGNLAGALSGISQALGLIRPNQSMESIAGLAQRIEAAKPALAKAAPAQPLFMLLEQIGETYAGLGLNDPTNPAVVTDNLSTQVKMIGWYIEREQWIQAVTLLREWFVSWTMVQLNQTDILDSEARHSVETVLNSESKAWQKSKQLNLAFSPTFLSALPVIEQILDLWGQVTQTRNDINHAGMRPNPGQPEKLIEKVKDYHVQIQNLPLPTSAQPG
ncbi:MAG: TIGR02221 family CRISPR-associated protein, partial [Caldilineaceae bacterium]|nr:TIGR02221 family CRISPR-associated protein [Caldilineaceae bacterium]